tara:strand:+ start:13982 stop:14311 length:330 start_codon:yes stop_codon:yes gene_type:complete
MKLRTIIFEMANDDVLTGIHDYMVGKTTMIEAYIKAAEELDTPGTAPKTRKLLKDIDLRINRARFLSDIEYEKAAVMGGDKRAVYPLHMGKRMKYVRSTHQVIAQWNKA